MRQFDVIVIGGGHAGAEAAALSARMGARTLLLTQNLETIGQMSCNPAIGGIAKGTVVREVDALGGIMGRATDAARIQFRMLNRSKGPAVHSPRAQCDRSRYRSAVRSLLERHTLLEFAQGTVAQLLTRGARVVGVVTVDGQRLDAAAVVVTTGTFLRGRIHLGLQTQVPAGRAGEAPAVALAEAFEDLGLTPARFKTGTPPRIDGRSVDFSQLQRQDGDPRNYQFSFFERRAELPQLPCWLTWSTPVLKEIIQRHLRESALYGGAISGRGPRYCPSIEDKIVKFADAERHQVFLEPEGLDTSEMYVNGLSTSLPPAVQLEFLRTVPGLANVRMTRPGYAIEYDYFPPTNLAPTLEVKGVANLFFAGQINGTTGYEEAAGQGAIAGINAAAAAVGKEPLILRRNEAFVGVLVDDLVSRGVDEPYRLFTSRAEYRLSLRQDNALRRLLPHAEARSLLPDSELAIAHSRLRKEDEVLNVSRETLVSMSPRVPVGPKETNRSRATAAEARISSGRPLGEILSDAGITVDPESAEWADIELRYQGYLEREHRSASRLSEMEGFELAPDLRYRDLTSLSYESREKLDAVRPRTLGQAGRIPGVSPSDLQCLVMEVVKRRGRGLGSHRVASRGSRVAVAAHESRVESQSPEVTTTMDTRELKVEREESEVQ